MACCDVKGSFEPIDSTSFGTRYLRPEAVPEKRSLDFAANANGLQVLSAHSHPSAHDFVYELRLGARNSQVVTVDQSPHSPNPGRLELTPEGVS
jgi:hypothetical protein